MRYKSLPLYVRSGGHGRVVQRSQPPAPRPPSRLRDWIATLPVLLLVFGLVIGQVVHATVPSLHLEGAPTPGGLVSIHGAAFPQPQVQLWWDASAKGMPAATVLADGSFMTDLQVPSNAAA
ncbi:MAG TPA: hypothetical protein VF114_01420, partial [Candidatus Limnocylindria bacterium]